MRTENGIGAPEYLNEAFFEDVLENGLPEANVKTKSISLTLGSSEGENYCSQIYRAKVNFQRGQNDDTEHQSSVIVKSIPLPEEMNFLDDLQVYHKEKVFYMDILPKLEILLDDTRFAPKCFYATKKPVHTITFDDMSAKGYVMADREAGLDEYHTKLALEKLGRFHAVSMVYAKKEPKMMSHFRTGFLDPKAMNPSCVLYKLFYKYLAHVIKLVSQWQGYEAIARKLQIYYENFHARLTASQAPREGELKVLNHGDFWVNNLLFKYKGDKVQDVVFIDFQMCVFASPGVDLNYFLHASVQLDVLKKLDMLLHTYHAALSDTLLQLGYDNIPTYEDIFEEFKLRSSYAVFTLFGPLPVMRMDKSKCEGNSFENLADSDESEEKMQATFSSETLQQHLRHSLRVIDDLGGLDG